MKAYPINIQDVLFELSGIYAPQTECRMSIDNGIAKIEYKLDSSDKELKAYEIPASRLKFMVEVAETGDQLDTYDTYAEAQAKVKEYFEEDTEDVDIDDLKTRRELESYYDIRVII